MPIAPALPVDTINIGLLSRGDGSFHWAIMVPFNETCAHVMQATNIQGPWVYERKIEDVLKSQRTVVIVGIGEHATIFLAE